MKSRPRLRSVPLSLMVLLLLAVSPLSAQDDDAEELDETDSGRGKIFAEISVWLSQTAGEDFFPATRQSPNATIFDVGTVLQPTYRTQTKFRYRGGYELPNDLGSIKLTWFAHDQDLDLSDSAAGAFIFGETLVHPTYAGFGNDGFADGFTWSGRTVLRDLRLDYSRKAFQSKRVSGEWYVGYRKVKSSRSEGAIYSALAPNLPPLLPPFVPMARPDLEPNSDEGFQQSSFRGRGVEVGLDIEFPLFRDRIRVETGLGIAVLRGKISTDYRSTTWFYVENQAGGPVILGPNDYNDAFGGTVGGQPRVTNVQQQFFPLRLSSSSISTSNLITEAYLGVRVKVWRELEWFGGFRSAFYGDIAVDLRPRSVDNSAAGTNFVDLSRESKSVTYEGFYSGLSYRF